MGGKGVLAIQIMGKEVLVIEIMRREGVLAIPLMREAKGVLAIQIMGERGPCNTNNVGEGSLQSIRMGWEENVHLDTQVERIKGSLQYTGR